MLCAQTRIKKISKTTVEYVLFQFTEKELVLNAWKVKEICWLQLFAGWMQMCVWIFVSTTLWLVWMAPSAGYSQYICVYVRNQTNTHSNCLKRFIFMLNSRESLENELTTTQNGKIQAEHAANMFCVLKCV